MAEEEKKAIEILNYFKVIVGTYRYEKETEAIGTILKLVDKQEKEIEKYKETEQKIKDKINDYKTRTKYVADIYNPIYLEIAKDFEELLEED